ncbi:MAG: hypothetical protein LBG83_08925 [Oscillospiraceae bacterium]|nr:hypothetical protein [Oscillospiraceae bacterium]
MKLQQTKKWAAAILAITSIVFCLSALSAVPAAAISIDGEVGYLEWLNCPKTEFVRQESDSRCAISQATLYYSVGSARDEIFFGFFVVAPEAQAGAPVGVRFLSGGQTIANWQLGAESAGSAEIALQGAAWFPSESAVNSYYNIEIALSSRSPDTAAFAQTMRALQAQLYDPQGEPSRVFDFPIMIEEPTTATTTTTTTTTKATTTTTTKAATTTTTKAATTTTTKAATTTAAAAATLKTGAATESATTTPAVVAAKTITSAPLTRTEIFMYTVPITGQPGKSAGASGSAEPASAAPETFLAEFSAGTIDPSWAYPYAASTAQQNEVAAAPTFAAEEPAPPASLRAPLLFGAGGFLLVLSLLLLFLWAKAQRKNDGGQ